MDKNGKNKTQRIYRCRSYNALSKLIVGNGLEDLWRMENSDSSEFSHCDRSSGKENARTLSRNFTNQENIRISRLKRRLRSLYKKKILNQKLNQ